MNITKETVKLNTVQFYNVEYLTNTARLTHPISRIFN